MQTNNQISLVRKTIYVIMLISLFYSMFNGGSVEFVRAQSIEADTLTKKSITATSNNSNPEISDAEVVALLKNTLRQNALVKDGEEAITFQIQRDITGLIVVGYAIIEQNKPPRSISPSISILGYSDGQWEARLASVHMDNFNIWLAQISEDILPEVVKPLYMYTEGIITAQAYTNHYLPWQNGVSHTVTKWPASSTNSIKHSGKESGAWDWYMPIGTELWASSAGYVKFIYESSTNPTASSFTYSGGWWCTPSGTQPNYVVVNNDDGSASLYLHLQNQGAWPSVGEHINRGDRVGYSGNTGYVCTSQTPSSTTGAHLHFQVQQQSTSSWYTQSSDVVFSDSGWSATNANPVSSNTKVATCTPGNQVDSSFFSDVLGMMNIPVTQFALDVFSKWMPYENTTACWNPLATTYQVAWMPAGTGCSETVFNSAGVRNYSSKYCGELATAQTLFAGSGSYYQPIRDLLAKQSFEWQPIHDSLMKWIGSDAYSTALANQWQTLWNSQGVTVTVPSGFNQILSDIGVSLYKKDYAGGQPDYVQRVSLLQGASLQLFHGGVVDLGIGQGSYGGNSAKFNRTSLSTAWSNFSSANSGAFCTTNGQFFSIQDPAPLAFPLKKDGQILSDGYGSTTEFPGQLEMLEIWSDHVDIKTLSKDALYNSSAPNILGGLSENANKSMTSYVGRTFAGIDDTDGDGLYDTVYIYNSIYARQIDATTVLTNFGADKIIMFDGGGSTQLNCGGTNYITSSRTIPQTIGVVRGGILPNAPINLTVSNATSNSLTLNWQDNSSNETGFIVYRWGYDGSQWTFIPLATVGANITTYTQTGLDCENDFNYYEVSAYITNGESSHAGWVQGVTAACPPMIDNAPIVLSSIRAGTSPIDVASVDFTVTFSEPVTGVDVSDFNLTTTGVSGAAVSGISGSGSVYTVTVSTGSGNGQIHLNVVNDGTIKNAALNQLAAGFFSGETYTVSKFPTFEDVPFSYWANSYIERLSSAGVTGGCSTVPLNYCPDNTVTRAQMAVFLLKGIHGSNFTPSAVGANTGFTDVATDYWAAAWIKQLAAEGITGGCGTGVYCPDNTVTRAQMAIFLLKAKHGSSYSPPNAIGIFTDVPVGYWADKWIEQLAAEGVTSGCGAGIYCPDADVTRAQMAVFLVKAFGLP